MTKVFFEGTIVSAVRKAGLFYYRLDCEAGNIPMSSFIEIPIGPCKGHGKLVKVEKAHEKRNFTFLSIFAEGVE